MGDLKKIKNAYDFLALNQNNEFNWQDLVNASGWSEKTAKTYKSKKFTQFLSINSNKCTVKKPFLSYSKFQNIFKQALKINPWDNHLTQSIAIIKSAIGIYNNPNIQYKEDTAITLLISAYNSLLIAIAIKNNIPYEDETKENYTINLKKLLDIFNTNYKDNFKKEAPEFVTSMQNNITTLCEYRNQFIHNSSIIIDNKQDRESTFAKLWGLMCASLNNYNIILKQIFDDNISDSLYFALQFSNQLISNRLKFSNQQLKKFFDNTHDNEDNSKYYSMSFYIIPKLNKKGDYPVQYITSPEIAEYIDKKKHIMVEKAVPRDEVLAKEIVKNIQEKCDLKITPTDLCNLAKKLKWRNSNNTSNNEKFYLYNKTRKQSSYTSHTANEVIQIIKNKDTAYFQSIFSKKALDKLQALKTNK